MTAELTFARNLPVWTKLERNGGGSLRFSIGRIDGKTEAEISLGRPDETRTIAHAMLEAIGDPVPGQPGELLANLEAVRAVSPVKVIRQVGRGELVRFQFVSAEAVIREAPDFDEEVTVFVPIFHIDAKPAPAPQPERTIVKVGGYTADPARNAQVGA